MWIGKGLVIGVVASLAVGAGLIASEAASKPSSGALDDSPMTVPVGRIGDRFTYSTFEREDPSQPWRPTDAPSRYGGSFEVSSVGQSADMEGGPHPAVFVRTQGRGDGAPRYIWGYGACCFEFVKEYGITLDRRESLSTAYDYQENASANPLVTERRSGSHMSFGPWDMYMSPKGKYHGSPEGYRDVWQVFLPLVYQGHTFRLGEDVPAQVRTAVLGQGGNSVFEGEFAILDFEYRAAIVDRRLVVDYDSYNLRSEGCLRPHQFPDSWSHSHPATVDGIGFLGVDIPWEKRACFQVDAWLTDAVPYPVLVERQIWVDGIPFHAQAQALSAYEAGSRPIPWTQPDGTPRYIRTVERERSGEDVFHHVDGTGNGAAFRLAEALASVDQSLVLVEFDAWKQKHPGNLLAGYTLSPRDPDVLRWDLIFADRDGSAYVVTVDKGPPAPVPRVAPVGEFRIQPFDAALHFPAYTNLVTISTGQRIWDDVLGDAWSGNPANFVRWGFQYTPARVDCPTPEACAAREASVAPWAYNHVAILMGHSSNDQAAGPADAEAGLESWSLDSYVLLSRFGDVWGAGHAKAFHEFSPLAADDPAPPEKIATSLPASWPLQIGTSMLVTSSLLAVFLAVYFFPLLKQLGVEFAMGVPGYAKLHKKELLNNQFRDRITGLIRAEPGITPSELQAAVGGSFNTIIYHLRVLRRNKMVSSLVDGRHKRFFPTEQVSWGERGRLAALRNAKTRQLYELIHEQPGIAPRDLSRRAGVSRPAIYWHVDRLVRVGLVGHDKEAGRTRFYASEPNFAAPARADAADLEVA